MKILLQPDPILSVVCDPIAPEDYARWRAIGTEMLKVMRAHKGVGLAAPQVGIAARCFVVSVSGIEFVALNPIITYRRGREGAMEGCLSAPGRYVRVDRAQAIRLAYVAPNGEPVERRAAGLLARVIQHESDHLDGLCMVK